MNRAERTAEELARMRVAESIWARSRGSLEDYEALRDAENALMAAAWAEGYEAARVAEALQPREPSPDSCESSTTVYADGDGPEEAIRNALGARSYESRSQCEACGYGGEHVYAITLTARKVER